MRLHNTHADTPRKHTSVITRCSTRDEDDSVVGAPEVLLASLHTVLCCTIVLYCTVRWGESLHVRWQGWRRDGAGIDMGQR
jgi:hypothetical protein